MSLFVIRKKVDITHEDGNVIHLSFKTNTKGNA